MKKGGVAVKKSVAITIISVLAVLAIILGVLYFTNDANKQKEIQELNADVADKAGQIETLNADVADKAGQIETLNADVANKAGQIETLNADVADKAGQIETLNADVADKAGQIETLNADVADKAVQIEKLKKDVSEKEEQIKELNAELDEKENVIGTLNNDIKNYDSQIKKLTSEAAEKEKQIESLRADNESKGTQIIKLTAEVETKDALIETLKELAAAGKEENSETEKENDKDVGEKDQKQDTEPTQTEPEKTSEKKEKPTNKFYSDGSIKVEYEFDTEDNVNKINYYNRYGVVDQYDVILSRDNDGNILSEITYYPQDISEYAKQCYSYSYDQNGNRISSCGTLENGTQLSKWSAKYDANGKRTELVNYDESGNVSSYEEGFKYDQDDNLISFTSLDAQRNVAYYYSAVWKDGVRIEYTDTYPNGNIRSHHTYDPVYGDVLTSEWYENDYYSKSIWTYGASSYEEDYSSISNGYQYRGVTLYDLNGKQLKTDSYKRDENDTKWILNSETIYEYLNNGHIIGTSNYEDGSKIINESDKDGKTLNSTYYRADGSISFSTEDFYDKKGQHIRTNAFDENGEASWYTVFEYDSMGREIQETTYHKDGTKSHETMYRYLDDGTRQTKRNIYSYDGTLNDEGEWE